MKVNVVDKALLIRLGTPGIEARLKALGATAGRPWRKEQKLTCLAAWAAVVARR